MSSWTELSLRSQGCEPPSPEQIWCVSSQKHLNPRQAQDCPAHLFPTLLLAPPHTALAAGDTDVTSWLRSPAGEGKIPG